MYSIRAARTVKSKPSVSTAESRHFDPSCRDCPRLAGFLDAVKREHPQYHARPVPPFGDIRARLLIVGLAPGMHGANRTGRPFTGDHAGILLYRTLYRYGFASSDRSVSADDPLTLRDCRITNAVKCLPPQNKPQPIEIRTCNRYLAAELTTMPADGVVLALGAIAHRAVLMAVACKPNLYPFKHGAVHSLPGSSTLFDSYHCSRYNTQTNRLSAPMFEAVFDAITRHLQHAESPRVRSH